MRELHCRTYRRTARFLDDYYDIQIHWTTLQKAAKRLPLFILQELLRTTAPDFCYLAAIDASGYSRRNPSEHYLRRIDGQRPAVPVKLSIMVDTDSRRVLSARARVRPVHDTRDVPGLIRQSALRPYAIVMDKGYDSEPLHKRLDRLSIWSIAPTRKRCRKGFHRKKLRDAFPEGEYGQRNIVEAVFKSLKQRFGGHVRGRSARTIRAELFVRLILHNISAFLRDFFYTAAPSQTLPPWEYISFIYLSG